MDYGIIPLLENREHRCSIFLENSKQIDLPKDSMGELIR